MNWQRIPIYLILFWFTCIQGIIVHAQEPVFTELQDQVRTQVHKGVYTLVDFVDVTLPIQGRQDSLYTMEFLEEWIIQPREHTIAKQVLDQNSSCLSLFKTLPEGKAGKVFRDLSYEFYLLDPHLIASGNVAFPEPDSMDIPTRQLQESLINLIKNLSKIAYQYPLEDQLLSLIFHEDWSLDPETPVITKEVRGITPVIWQRRQTVSGDPVNDGDTGLPVYFKIQLEQIDLRNP